MSRLRFVGFTNPSSWLGSTPAKGAGTMTGAGIDELFGNRGSDSLAGGAGRDALDGGSGFDYYDHDDTDTLQRSVEY